MKLPQLKDGGKSSEGDASAGKEWPSESSVSFGWLRGCAYDGQPRGHEAILYHSPAALTEFSSRLTLPSATTLHKRPGESNALRLTLLHSKLCLGRYSIPPSRASGVGTFAIGPRCLSPRGSAHDCGARACLLRRSLLQDTVQLAHTPAMSVWHQVGPCAHSATDRAAAVVARLVNLGALSPSVPDQVFCRSAGAANTQRLAHLVAEVDHISSKDRKVSCTRYNVGRTPSRRPHQPLRAHHEASSAPNAPHHCLQSPQS